jgi:hypothetical protein
MWQPFWFCLFCASAMFGVNWPFGMRSTIMRLLQMTWRQTTCVKTDRHFRNFNWVYNRDKDRNIIWFLFFLLCFPNKRMFLCKQDKKWPTLQRNTQTLLRCTLYIKCKYPRYSVIVILFSPQEKWGLFSAGFRKTHKRSTALSEDIVCRILPRSGDKCENQSICVPN